MWTAWVLILAVVLAAVLFLVFFFRIRAELIFATQPSWQARFTLKAWPLRPRTWTLPLERASQTEVDGKSDPDTASTFAAFAEALRAKPHANPKDLWNDTLREKSASGQAGFLRLPRWAALRRKAKDRAKRALFLLLSDFRFWWGLLRAIFRLPRVLWKGLHVDILRLDFSHNQPEKLGPWVAWAGAFATVVNHPLPLGYDFEARQSGVRGEVRAQLSLAGLVLLLFSILAGFPWRRLLWDLLRGFLWKTLPGRRESLYRFLMKVLSWDRKAFFRRKAA